MNKLAERIRLDVLTGDDLERHLWDLAQLRIEVFREYPYLYIGSMEYEARYLRAYQEAEESVIIGAFDGERLIGAATGLPLLEEPPTMTEPFRAKGLEPEQFFYFGESVLQESYRGLGIGVRFFHEREAYARSLNRFAYCCFCAVERPADDPRRPADYRSLDGFWNNRGYRKVEDMTVSLSWQDADEAAESLKPMSVWMKAL
ncbi:GNAT family N-acetyltransferase [Fodinicurvata sediminis]|uniref:GNAT family N-acetyltransferase n=1 Tax=Fodinicurvata sediminis TaxID=1121832 RepID=UPI0003B709CF|nr:GNAT family N-acetyltransferase [Fodinicurvata sediminis]